MLLNDASDTFPEPLSKNEDGEIDIEEPEAPVFSEVNQVKAGRIFLTGFMGAGKTTIGKLLARQLKRRFYDTDQLIVKGFGNQSVSQIFERHGEPAFREAETQVLSELCKRTNFVASTGGGTLVRPDTMRTALDGGIVIYLYAPLEVLFERVLYSVKDRPVLSTKDTEKHFRERFMAREAFYEQAHLTVATHEDDRDEIVRQIMSQLATISV